MQNTAPDSRRLCRPLFLFFFLLVLYPFFSSSVNVSAGKPLQDEAGKASDTVTGDDIKRGGRLFQGLLPPGPGASSCASCHNVNPVDSFNWNPSAYEIARLYKDKTAEELEAVVMEPATAKMTEVHVDYELSGEDFVVIKAWMDDFSKRGMEERPVINRLLLFLLMLVIFLAAIADLAIFRKIPLKLVHLAVILGTGLFMVKTIAHEAVALGRSQYYEPDQPVKFSHRVHADENQTDCLYCHSLAEYSHQAGIPSTSQCMNCHIIVREGSNSGRFEINKLVRAYESELPVRWIRVHNLPDHVFFSHAQHVGAAGLDCSECHGEVETMDRLMQVSDLSMGWCLDCHRSTEVDILNNEFYSVYMQLREDVRTGRIDLVTARETGGTECMKCHY
ncbi:MAG: cytochrome c3 family protein [Bacteroidales bacterium]